MSGLRVGSMLARISARNLSNLMSTRLVMSAQVRARHVGAGDGASVLGAVRG
jgi:hypothetical protein